MCLTIRFKEQSLCVYANGCGRISALAPRCVVCRDGVAVEMSFDHKPEDEVEIP